MVDYVLAGLVKRRAEMTGRIEALHTEMRDLLSQLDALDATIIQFDADFKVESIRPKAFRPPSDWAHRGEMSRVVLSILRQATEPMTTRDITLELLVTRAMDPDDRKLLRTMLRRVAAALRNQRDGGTLRSTQGTGQFVLWEVAR